MGRFSEFGEHNSDETKRGSKFKEIHEYKEQEDIEREVRKLIEEIEFEEKTEEMVKEFIQKLETKENTEHRIKKFIEELEKKEQKMEEVSEEIDNEQLKQYKRKQGADPKWEQRCNEVLDEIERESKQKTILNEWEECRKRAVDDIEKQAERSEKSTNEITDSQKDMDLSDWEEKCELALEEIEKEFKKKEFENNKNENKEIQNCEIIECSSDEKIQKLKQSIEESDIEKEKSEETSSIPEKIDVEEIQKNPPWIIRTREHLSKALERNPEKLYGESIEKEFHRACVYCELMEHLDSGDIENSPSSYSEFAKEHDLHRKTVTDWVEEKKKPRLVKDLEKSELEKCFEVERESPLEVTIDSMDDIDYLKEKHGIQSNSESYRRCQVYFEVKDNWSMTEEQLSEIHEIPKSTISCYRKRIYEPKLITDLRAIEEKSILKEWVQSGNWLEIENENLSKKIGAYEDYQEIKNLSKTIRQIDSTELEKFSKIENESFSVEKITDVLKAQFQSEFIETETKLCILDIKSLKEIDQFIQQNMELSIRLLRERLNDNDSNYEYRIGLVKDNLYVWKHNTSGTNLMAAYKNQYYYFSNAEIAAQIVRLSAHYLGCENQIIEAHFHVNNLMNQLGIENAIQKLKGNRIRINGEAMHFLSDIRGNSSGNYEGYIEKITGSNGHGGILNPRYLDETEFETTIAGVIGALVSDSHVPSSGSIAYYESNLGRIEMFKELLSRFGEIQWKENVKKVNGAYENYIPSPISDVVRFFGIPHGDRTILNYGLPSESHTWSSTAMCEYMKQMLAQEGNVGKDGRITWTRSHALDAGDKADNYSFNSLLSRKSISFLRESNEMKQLGRKDNLEKIRERYITMGRLKSLANNQNSAVSEIANELLDVISNNRNRLIDDEVRMARKLGIKVSLSPLRLSYHENSGRVTINWGANIDNYNSRVRSAKLFPPAHPEKLQVSKTFLTSQNEQKNYEN